MTRTQIYLPAEIHSWAKTIAQEKNISMAAFIRECVGSRCRNMKKKSAPKILNRTAKGLLSLSGLVKKGPRDMGKNHDYYLYGSPKK